MRTLGERLRHEEMIERIAMVNRESGQRNQMGIGDVQALKAFAREDAKNFRDIRIELADAQLHGDLP